MNLNKSEKYDRISQDLKAQGDSSPVVDSGRAGYMIASALFALASQVARLVENLEKDSFTGGGR